MVRNSIKVLLSSGVLALALPGVAQASPPSCGAPVAGAGGSLVVSCSSVRAEQAFTVPAGVSSLHIQAVGGSGGGGAVAGNGNGPGFNGAGAVITADVPVTPGSTLYVTVGGNAVGAVGG